MYEDMETIEGTRFVVSTIHPPPMSMDPQEDNYISTEFSMRRGWFKTLSQLSCFILFHSPLCTSPCNTSILHMYVPIHTASSHPSLHIQHLYTPHVRTHPHCVLTPYPPYTTPLKSTVTGWLSNCKMQMFVVSMQTNAANPPPPPCYKTRLSLCGHILHLKTNLQQNLCNRTLKTQDPRPFLIWKSSSQNNRPGLAGLEHSCCKDSAKPCRFLLFRNY